MKTDGLKDAVSTYSELLRTYQLNIELLNALEETLLHVQNFCKSYNIPFKNEKLCSSLAKVENLLDEISLGLPPNVLFKPTDESLHERRNRRRLDRTSDDKLKIIGRTDVLTKSPKFREN